MSRLLAVKLILSLTLLLACFDAQAKLFNAERFILDNGLEVILVQNHRAPIIKQMLIFKAGSVHEELGKGGSAHLLEHLMFRGTKTVKGQDFNRLMEENGAESNAFTSLDMTAYHQLLDISRLELAMFLEADRAENLQISAKDFELERDIVYQERKQRTDTSPLAVFGEEMRRVLWQDNPYGRTVSGKEAEILALRRSDVTDYYHKNYAPQNAVLVLAGDIDLAMAKKLAQKYYGGLEKGEVLKEKEFPNLRKTAGRIEMRLPNVQSPRVMKMVATSSYQYEPEWVYPLQLLASYMGEGESSKLYKKLVVEQKKALDVSVDYQPLTLSYGVFSVAALPAEGVMVQELETALAKAWNEAVTELNLDELQKAKQKMLAGLVYLRDNPSDAAVILGTMRAVGVPLDEIENMEEKIRAVDYHQVRKAAEKLAQDMPQVTGILLPEGYANAQ